RETGLPLVIHTRDADEEAAAILREEMARGPFKALLHCYTGGRALAETSIELGLYVSFSGILTFPKSGALRELAAALPLDRLLVETDAPFLAPAPLRGKRNEPAFVRHTAKVLAGVKGISEAEVEEATTANFFTLVAKAKAVAGAK
ncbi:MAG: TatD family hydrolase, partial [Rhodomicrobium sp.]